MAPHTRIHEEAGEAGLKEPSVNDVISGRGDTINRHPGNVQFRKLVEENRRVYVCARFKREKRMIAEGIITAIRQMEPPGRFLAKRASTGLWHIIGEDKAREKTSQALRENAKHYKDDLLEMEHQQKQKQSGRGGVPHLPPAYACNRSTSSGSSSTTNSVPYGNPHPHGYPPIMTASTTSNGTMNGNGTANTQQQYDSSNFHYPYRHGLVPLQPATTRSSSSSSSSSGLSMPSLSASTNSMPGLVAEQDHNKGQTYVPFLHQDTAGIIGQHHQPPVQSYGNSNNSSHNSYNHSCSSHSNYPAAVVTNNDAHYVYNNSNNNGDRRNDGGGPTSSTFGSGHGSGSTAWPTLVPHNESSRTTSTTLRNHSMMNNQDDHHHHVKNTIGHTHPAGIEPLPIKNIKAHSVHEQQQHDCGICSSDHLHSFVMDDHLTGSITYDGGDGELAEHRQPTRKSHGDHPWNVPQSPIQWQQQHHHNTINKQSLSPIPILSASALMDFDHMDELVPETGSLASSFDIEIDDIDEDIHAILAPTHDNNKLEEERETSLLMDKDPDHMMFSAFPSSPHDSCCCLASLFGEHQQEQLALHASLFGGDTSLSSSPLPLPFSAFSPITGGGAAYNMMALDDMLRFANAATNNNNYHNNDNGGGDQGSSLFPYGGGFDTALSGAAPAGLFQPMDGDDAYQPIKFSPTTFSPRAA